ncbi:LemA family protein [Marinibaculum pumilum]|uniref:LemA family protein n=1 Tax=Marinibaculum pumilum TaxID=1766165 RepID=A0ABV7L554_9PROT
MDITTIVILVVVALILVYGISIYNRLVALKHNVDEAWSNIDVLLKQRYEELPKLVETCKQYMSYEQEVLEKVTALRNEAETARRDGDVGEVNRTEGALGLAVTGLLARAEAYPDLKAAESFRQLLGRISALEESISDRREFYNEAVNINNIRREQFPDMLVAKPFGFGAKPLFEAEPEATKNVDMKALFGA